MGAGSVRSIGRKCALTRARSSARKTKRARERGRLRPYSFINRSSITLQHIVTRFYIPPSDCCPIALSSALRVCVFLSQRTPIFPTRSSSKSSLHLTDSNLQTCSCQLHQYCRSPSSPGARSPQRPLRPRRRTPPVPVPVQLAISVCIVKLSDSKDQVSMKPPPLFPAPRSPSSAQTRTTIRIQTRRCTDMGSEHSLVELHSMHLDWERVEPTRKRQTT